MTTFTKEETEDAVREAMSINKSKKMPSAKDC